MAATAWSRCAEMPKSAQHGVTPDYWDEACKHLARRDRVMKKLIPQFGEARLQSRGDAFTTLARSIVGQQISVKAAQSVWDRFVALLGAPSTRVAPALVEAHGRQRAARGRAVAAQGRVPARPGAPLQLRRGACAAMAADGRRGHHRRAGGHPRHRPLDGGDVPDLPPDAPERAAAGRPGPAQGHQPELLQRRAGVARRGPRGGRCLGAVPLGGHLVHLAQPGSAAGRLSANVHGCALRAIRQDQSHEQATFPRVRAADRRTRFEDRGTALRAERIGRRHLRRDRAPGPQEPAADQGHLLQPDALAGDADRAPPAAALHAGLRRRDLHRLPGTARRPPASPTTCRSSAAWRASTARPAWCSATRRAATPRSAACATSAWRGPRATARRCA